MAIWTEFVCICTEACGTWLGANNPDNIDFDGKTEGVDYIILKLVKDQEVETPDVNVKGMGDILVEVPLTMVEEMVIVGKFKRLTVLLLWDVEAGRPAAL